MMNEAASLYSLTHVRKRDGQTLQPFDASKIEDAVRKAWTAVEGAADPMRVRRVVGEVFAALSGAGPAVDVEQVQDHVEVALMRCGKPQVAKAYIIYREKRAEARRARKVPDTAAVADYIHFSKYARHRPDLGRRELFHETVDRVEAMHIKRFAQVPDLLPDIRWAFDRVREKRVLPSMRSMQFGGRAIEANNCRIFNCSFTLIDRVAAFQQTLFLLLSGCGVGYSVQHEHVERLPTLDRIDPRNVVHHIVQDTIEGWADALGELFRSYVEGYNVEFAYHLIRPAGVPLKTSGGRAPGHLQLKASLEAVRAILHAAQGRKLRPIECHDILCRTADAPLAGGIRRSAMIALFSLDDGEMLHAKTGDWYSTHPWRANANNSVVLKRDEVTEKAFKRVFQMTRQWGEPGFFFTSYFDYGTNPCAEIGLNPVLCIDDDVSALLLARVQHGKPMPDVRLGERFTGWAFCNLCEINAAKFESVGDFAQAAKAAAIIGTLQASYTDMPYLGWVSEVIAEREALLGIGMTGMMDTPGVALDAENQRTVARRVLEWNSEYAAKIGIRPAARATCVKPSGTTSLELGCVGSGIHAHHARRYFRRVTADELEVVFQAFRAVNPHACVRKPDGKWVIEFAVEAPVGAVLKEDMDALSFLRKVRSTQEHWVLAGTARPESSPGLNHNVSNTVQVRLDEWGAVADYLWRHRDSFTGVTLLAATGDKDYAFAPHESVVTEEDEVRWGKLVGSYRPVDYSTVLEVEDGTEQVAEPACAGGSCEIK